MTLSINQDSLAATITEAEVEAAGGNLQISFQTTFNYDDNHDTFGGSFQPALSGDEPGTSLPIDPLNVKDPNFSQNHLFWSLTYHVITQVNGGNPGGTGPLELDLTITKNFFTSLESAYAPYFSNIGTFDDHFTLSVSEASQIASIPVTLTFNNGNGNTPPVAENFRVFEPPDAVIDLTDHVTDHDGDQVTLVNANLSGPGEFFFIASTGHAPVPIPITPFSRTTAFDALVTDPADIHPFVTSPLYIAVFQNDLFLTLPQTFEVQFPIDYTVDDGHGNKASATITVELQGQGPPTFKLDAAMVSRDGNSGTFEAYDISNNTILVASQLGQVGREWQFAGLGNFNASDTTDMILRNSNNGAFEVYDISNGAITSAAAMGQVGLDWQVAGVGGFSGNAGDGMLLRNSTGAFEVYTINNNVITSAAAMGQVGSDWQVVGFGSFNDNPNETDMLLRNVNSGAFEVYDINNNKITSAAAMGQVGLEWQVAGFGNFSSRPNETDMIMRNSNTGAFEVYDIANNALIGAYSMGAVGLDWQVAGFGNFSGNANETDMIMRNANTAALEVYDIANNAPTAAYSMGAIGLNWQVDGIAVDLPTASQLVQAMAGFGGGAADSSTTVALGAETSQQPFLTMPQHA